MVIKDIKFRIKEYFLMMPSESLRVREIERSLNLPLPSVIRYCKELEKEGILKIKRIGNVQFYTADRSNENYLLEKKLFNIRQIYNSGVMEYLRECFNNPAIVLFGSYLRGEDTEDSDVDLYIGTNLKKDVDVRKFEKRLKRKIQLFKYAKVSDIPNPHLANNIINGLTINSYIEVFK